MSVFRKNTNTKLTKTPKVAPLHFLSGVLKRETISKLSRKGSTHLREKCDDNSCPFGTVETISVSCHRFPGGLGGGSESPALSLAAGHPEVQQVEGVAIGLNPASCS